MYCRFCGKEKPDSAKFCGYCGKSESEKFSKFFSLSNKSDLLIYILGVAFILVGFLPYLLQKDTPVYQNAVWSQKFGNLGFASIISFRNFYSLFTSVFYASSSAFAIYTGFLLFKKEINMKSALIINTIIHSLSVIASIVLNILVFSFPKEVLIFLNSPESIIEKGAEIIDNHPYVLSCDQHNAIVRAITSVIIIALSLFFIFSKKQYAQHLSLKHKKTFPIGGFLMLLSLPILSILSGIISNYIGSIYGEYEIGALSSAQSAFNLTFSEIETWLVWIVIAIAIFFNKAKKVAVLIPTISILLLLGTIAFLLSNTILQAFNTPAEIFGLSIQYLRFIIIAHTVSLISSFFWFYYISKNQVPKWLQITLPVSIPIIYIIIEYVFSCIMKLKLFYGGCNIIIYLITIFVPLFFRLKQHQKSLTIQELC
ncbi:MAG: zinc ribbon domain-containing protein [Clostridia bacterium]|nr:zinc ribbon domain-containing protein [Clostridia bacterium]